MAGMGSRRSGLGSNGIEVDAAVNTPSGGDHVNTVVTEGFKPRKKLKGKESRKTIPERGGMREDGCEDRG